MTTKRFNGKAIYQPTGKAAEYSPWACNFYTGCSNDCEYCYCKRGVMNHVWSTKPQLKKCFRNEEHALRVFVDEMFRNLDELRKRGILFSFTTDPMLLETYVLTLCAAEAANREGIPVKILTKRADVKIFNSVRDDTHFKDRSLVAFGFTLTGFDEKEPCASLNYERIEAMREVHNMGFRTFASIEPVITPAMSLNMIEATLGFCDLYKVGLISGKGKDFYNRDHMTYFWGWLTGKSLRHKIYLKDSFLAYFGITREQLKGDFVNANYNIFR